MSIFNPKWTYHPAASHADSKEFRERMELYRVKAIGACNVELVEIKRRQVLPIRKQK